MINTVRDNLSSNNDLTAITSGKFGERLEMRGSNLYFIRVFICFEVSQNPNSYFKRKTTYLIMEAEHTELGFNKLRFIHINDPGYFQVTEMKDRDNLFLNSSFKTVSENK